MAAGRRASAVALAALATAGASAAQAPPDSPAGVVTAVVRLDTGRGWAPLFAERPTAPMVRYFTPAFNAAWSNAMKHNREEPVLDGDPLTGAQGVTGIALVAVKPGPVRGNEASVVAVLKVRSDGASTPERQSVAFTLKRTGAGWQIDDISGPSDGTLRSRFRKACGQ